MSIRRGKGNTDTNRQAQGQSEEQEGNMNNDLRRLFLDELADVYSAEQQLTKALPKMAKAAQSEELRQAFESHLEQTQNHINRLEQVAEALGESIKKKKCEAMEGLVEEGEDIIEEQEGTSALDAGLILAAQKVEHYEIASYGALRAWAELMGHNEAAELLQETLNEEKETDEKLNQLAETAANQQAARQE